MKPLYSLLCAIPMAALPGCSPPTEPGDAEASPVVESPAQNELAADVPADLQAIGTEPFWSVKVEGDVLVYTTPETMDAPRRLQATRSIDADGLHLLGEDAGVPFRLDVRSEACSDGMSDHEYPFSASFVLDDSTMKGCAFDQVSPPPPQ
ncbi:conserved hypothetical protein [uncultured Stenotrophomonas sp.]|uniref:Lipoprotein n=1 Tax=uncultured Stenotrophomonas sp. TaxID=165438 RepID=A0A1Y5PYM5_9GAMM|nr:conserved hypothetical protein [uncultured Stenotrophomonas sp.]